MCIIHTRLREVILERPVFETARERRAEQEKMTEQMAHEEEDVDLHQAWLRSSRISAGILSVHGRRSRAYRAVSSTAVFVYDSPPSLSIFEKREGVA